MQIIKLDRNHKRYRDGMRYEILFNGDIKLYFSFQGLKELKRKIHYSLSEDGFLTEV